MLCPPGAASGRREAKSKKSGSLASYKMSSSSVKSPPRIQFPGNTLNIVPA